MRRLLDFITESIWYPKTVKLHHRRAENIGKALEKHYNYDEHEKTVISKYSFSSRGLNLALTLPLHNNQFKIRSSQHENLKSMMKKYKTPHDLHVYAGVGENRENLINKNKNSIINFPTYTSTSLSKGTAARFGEGAIVKIHVPKGSAGLYIHLGEHEFVLHHGAKIRLNRDYPQIIRDTRHNFFNKTRRIYHAKLVHDGIKEV